MRQQTTTTFAIHGPIARADLAGLYERVCRVLTRAGPVLLVCELRGVAADAVAVDALAQLALAARRHGSQVKVRGASRDLRELIAFMGLDQVLPD